MHFAARTGNLTNYHVVDDLKYSYKLTQNSSTTNKYLFNRKSKTLINSTLDCTSVGTQQIIFSVSDPSGNTTSVTVNLTVTDDLNSCVTASGSSPAVSDSDGDGVEDSIDAFPNDPTEWVDTDLDGIGNNSDTDDDNDGFADAGDAFPLDASETLDTDSDGIGNNADTDDDGDGVADTEDAYPLTAGESVDTDGDGVGNNTDTDDDNDNYLDCLLYTSDAADE